nr:hypothetical protein [Tanacetum cinerariifolium]GEZ31955.1 hypothetical protein [Tanacetum cinerariifolium]GEZ48118.1 hypothetical protein [Tanacetum cinerariifolium]
MTHSSSSVFNSNDLQLPSNINSTHHVGLWVVLRHQRITYSIVFVLESPFPPNCFDLLLGFSPEAMFGCVRRSDLVNCWGFRLGPLFVFEACVALISVGVFEWGPLFRSVEVRLSFSFKRFVSFASFPASGIPFVAFGIYCFSIVFACPLLCEAVWCSGSVGCLSPRYWVSSCGPVISTPSACGSVTYLVFHACSSVVGLSSQVNACGTS